MQALRGWRDIVGLDVTQKGVMLWLEGVGEHDLEPLVELVLVKGLTGEVGGSVVAVWEDRKDCITKGCLHSFYLTRITEN